MTKNAENYAQSRGEDTLLPSPAYVRAVEVRLAQPAARVRYEKGKPVKEPVPDMERVVRAIERPFTQAVQQELGVQTEVRLVVAKAGDIRLEGRFVERAADLKEKVGEMLADAIDGADLSE